ncbi:sugar phosphate isomerase/epimerase family protein [Mycetocola sp.]|uniref:sugar phosphate isomerase/epimerase family protein n=1 Tax=Mycetocola sp. TaxID=1871042 RepID=UPI0039897BE7
MSDRYPNPIGVHGLVWAGSWSENEARFAIEQSAAAGYDVIELLMMDPLSMDVERTRRLLDEYGMKASASLGLAPDTDVSSDDPDVVAAGRRVLSDALSVATDLGLVYLGGVVFGALNKYSAPVTARGRANSIEAVRVLSENGAKAGIPIGLEIVNRYESNLLNTAAQAMDYIQEVGSDNLFVHLDSYHMNIEENDMFQAVLTCGDRLGYVHIGEGHRGYLGTGTVDFHGLFRGMAHIGYTGPITFESFSSAVVDPGLSYTLAIWRNLWSDNVDLARHARGFIDAQVRSAARLQA